MESSPLYHLNVADGSKAKGVICKYCGEYVALVRSKKTGKWYTCQLVPSMNPDSEAKRAYPFLPHFPVCKENQARQAQMHEDAKRAENPERKAAIERYAEAVHEMSGMATDTEADYEALRAAMERVSEMKRELGDFNRFEEEHYFAHIKSLPK